MGRNAFILALLWSGLGAGSGLTQGEILGDLDGDGALAVADLVAMARHLNGENR